MTPDARRPSRRAFGVALGLLATALGIEVAALVTGAPPRVGPLALRTLWLAGLACTAVIAAVDWLRIRGLPTPAVERSLPTSLALHDWATVRLRVDPGPLAGPLTFLDETPVSTATEGLPAEWTARAGTGTFVLRYRLRPDARGDAAFGRVRIRGTSPAGLWQYVVRAGEPTTVRVFPNFATAARYDALLAEAQESLVGIVRRQRRGEGTEFHQLREYRRGDSARQIDWKATSRKQVLISREYEDERDQRILFVLDASRRMRAREGDLSHFDHCLNAMILLAHVALRGGDAVGLLSFGDRTRWLPPGKGVARINRVLDTVYDLEPTTAAADFRVAAQELSARAPRRALVVFLTTLREEDAADCLAGLSALRRRHLVLVANLAPPGLVDAVEQPVRDLPGALRWIGATAHTLERRRLNERLSHRGLPVLDVTPEELTPRLVSSYLAIKRSGAL